MWLVVSVETSAASTFADALAGDRSVIADDGELGLPLPDQFVQQTLGAFRPP